MSYFSTIFLTIWGYELSYLEFFALITSLIGVGLGIQARRITWPWWAISSLLYGLLFIQWKLYASAALQIVFIVAAIIGWFGWEPTGAKPAPLSNKRRLIITIAIALATLALGPILAHIGAASTYADAALFFGSLGAQILMVYEKYDNWPLWLVVDAGYTLLYATQHLLFTSVLYGIFTVMAAMGWSKWYATHRSALRSL